MSAPSSTPTSTGSTACQDVVDLGIPEMVDDESVAVVEWGDVAAPVLGPVALTVHLGRPGPRPAGQADEDAP